MNIFLKKVIDNKTNYVIIYTDKNNDKGEEL